MDFCDEIIKNVKSKDKTARRESKTILGVVLLIIIVIESGALYSFAWLEIDVFFFLLLTLCSLIDQFCCYIKNQSCDFDPDFKS